MAVPDIYSVRRILCSQCSHIHLSWTTQRTSLSKSLQMPCPSLFHLLFETQGWEVANRPSYVWRGRNPSSVDVLQHLRSAGPALFRSDGNSMRCEVVRALSNAHPLCGPRFNVLGRVPLMSLFLCQCGNSTPTILPCFRNLQHSNFHTALQTLPMSRARREAPSTR